ncbi:MAG: ascorbate-dependent monooxygenase [Candidatus Rokubacteria bacterium]|nr:ascorbate-dependent monooxygenase [Candidatus Rokubacteria bacterium]MBI3824895.1 ascorbate-dependent monooxygenase [Candidatus Rokubacteria bacterium]
MRRIVMLVLIAAAALAAEPARPAEEPVTFGDQISRVLQAHCQTCHRPEGGAPFSLLTYQDAYLWRQQIHVATQARRMPPWKPVAGHGDFAEVRRLSDTDLALIARWVKAGAPEGDPARLPPPRTFPPTWTLGQPGLVLEMDEAYTVAAGAGDVYRCFTLPTRYSYDLYLSAVEVIPGNKKIVHHVLTYLDTTGASLALDRADPGPGYTCFGGPGFAATGGLGGWAPGAPPLVMPSDVGVFLPAGARVVAQVHYNNRSERAETDRTRIGLHFIRQPVDKRLRVVPVLNRGFVIPAGAARHEVRASWTVPLAWNLHTIGIAPHMHLLGREMKVTATYPDGTVRPLIYIDDWDFNWQGAYTFARPIPLPGGTRIDVQAIYDNSADNPRQPNRPPRPVGWGEGTTDEMCIAFLRVTVDSERLGARPR